MGKYFAHRKYAFEMGGWQFYTKDDAIWFVLMQENNVIGFCSIIQEKTHLYFDNFYILKEYRSNGYSKDLFDARLTFAKSLKKEIRVITDNPIQMERYKNYGFKENGKRGKYTKFKL
jgi:GNAT superfamily N-acetyltransferase